MYKKSDYIVIIILAILTISAGLFFIFTRDSFRVGDTVAYIDSNNRKIVVFLPEDSGTEQEISFNFGLRKRATLKTISQGQDNLDNIDSVNLKSGDIYNFKNYIYHGKLKVGNLEYDLWVTTGDVPIITIESEERIENEPKVPCSLMIIDKDNITFTKSEIELIDIDDSILKDSYSLNIVENDITGETPTILDFGDTKRFRLCSSFTDRSFIREKLTYDIFRMLSPQNVSIMESTYVEVYLNDSFRGLYLLIERADRNMFSLSNYARKDKEHSVIYEASNSKADYLNGIEGFSQVEPDNEDDGPYFKPLEELIDFINNTDKETFIENVESIIDMDNLMDNYILFMLTGCSKKVASTNYLYKGENDSDKFNFSPGSHYISSFGKDKVFDIVEPDSSFSPVSIYNRLYENKTYRENIKKRWNDLRIGTVTFKNLCSLIDNSVSGLSNAVERDSLKWPLESTEDFVYRNFNDEIIYVKNFIYKRLFYLDSYFNVATPQFSKPAGFYEEEFELQLTADDPDTMIFYTLDGSEPSPYNTEGSVYYYKNKYSSSNNDSSNELIARNYITLPYTDPISLDIDSVDNNGSIVEINTTTASDSKKPLGDVTKAIVVRAIAYKEGFLPSQIVTNTYFIGQELTNRYNIPVISLVTNEYNLFDYETGIYVAGSIYDNWIESDPDRDLSWGEIPTNYNQRGSEWEREVSIEFFSPDNKLLLKQSAGVRIHGGSPRAYTQKSLRLYARKEYGEGLFNVQLFESKSLNRFKNFILRNSGNDNNSTMFRDALIQSLLKDLRVDRQAYQPAILYINGVYWGIYNIRERIDGYYLHYNYDVDLEQIDLLTGDADVKEGDNSHYKDMIEYIEANDMSIDSNYEYLGTLMDIDNFLNYNIAQIYSGNTDWPDNNIYYWRLKTEEYEPDAPYGHDGRWRWIIYDTDFGFGGDYSQNTLEHATQDHWSTFLLNSLFENEHFRNMFINRSADYLNTIFDPDIVLDQINDMHDNLAPLIQEHIDRWGRPKSVEEWENNIDVMRDFAENRPYYLREHIIEYFGLSGTARVYINTDLTKGKVVINSIDISQHMKESDNIGNWTGIYFKDVPIEITAVPNPGYVFDGWEELNTKEDTLTIKLIDDISLSATFTKK